MTGRPVGASVDIGSNSVHLLVAAIEGHRLAPLVDESAFLGLGAAVDARGSLGSAHRRELTAALGRYAATARRLGAETVTFMGTEPIRRAANAARVAAEIEATTHVPLHVLSHEEEAYLTLVGVTEGRPVTHETLVVDLGGGSSEFCVVGPGTRARAAGLLLGSNRLTSRHVRTDPPTDTEIAAMASAADELLRGAIDAHPTEIIIVGGTGSNLLKVTPDRIDDQVVTHERILGALEALTSGPAAATSERFGVNRVRARLLPAGAVAVDALMRRYGTPAVRVSHAGLREGAVLIADHAGRAWRDLLPELAHGWRA